MQTVNHKESIVSVNRVSFSYEGHEVLRDVSLEIHRGDYLGIVGGNGAGKTTFLKIILGLLRPTSGTVTLFGEDIARFKDWYRIGYVPQKATNFDANFPATAFEVVLMGRYGRRGLFRSVTKDDEQEALRALEHVGMAGKRGRIVGTLSGGEQQRIFIARALAGQPEILFLDEPTVGVEQQAKDEFYALLKKLNEALRLTVVLVTHDLESTSRQAMHVACIDRTLYFHDTVDDYFKNTHAKDRPHGQ